MSRRVLNGVATGMSLAEKGLAAYHTAKGGYAAGSAVASVLFDCFCLCNDCYFVDNEEKGKRDLQGPSQDELILLELAAQS